MVGGDEAVLLRGFGDPVVQAALAYLDHLVATLAQQVVVVLASAQAVALLAAMM
jgi:hypothetical protein